MAELLQHQCLEICGLVSAHCYVPQTQDTGIETMCQVHTLVVGPIALVNAHKDLHLLTENGQHFSSSAKLTPT